VFIEVECTNIGHIKVNNYYFFLMYCSFYFYEMTFFVSSDEFRLKVYFI
jgi:hypothetical protein